MNLSILERLVVSKVLPKEGDYATLKILTALRLALSFSEEELKAWGITSDLETGRTEWKENGEADIPIGEKATDIIVDGLKRLSKEKKLPLEAMSIYEKFIPTTE
ncbi:MAG TPA: hypothetical protein DCP69_00260 [Candidatus Omnitrophica bacterium]|nr:hypothetical protein [Candidatus Omnitrophota bacterium]